MLTPWMANSNVPRARPVPGCVKVRGRGETERSAGDHGVSKGT